MNKQKNNNVEVVAVDITNLIGNLLDGLTPTLEEPKKRFPSVDLEKEIDRVVFNDPATIVFWKDGTKTVTKCHDGDVFNKEAGLAICIVRKLTNNKNYNKIFEKFCQ